QRALGQLADRLREHRANGGHHRQAHPPETTALGACPVPERARRRKGYGSRHPFARGRGVMAMAGVATGLQGTSTALAAARVRNVALVGHNGSGKTTLAEALLHRAGVVNRLGRVEQGTTVCDHDPEEQRRLMSLSLAVAPFDWKGHRVNLIDTPGYADFMGDVVAALRVVDLAVFVVSAVDGVQAQTE